MARSPAELLAAGRPLTLGRRRGRRRGPRRRRSRARGCRARRRAGDQPAGGLPRRSAHGGARARARLLRARPRGAGVPGLGLPALRPGVAACGLRRAAHDRAVAARAPQGPRPPVGPAHHRQRRAPARAGARAWSPSSRSRSRPATCSRWTASPDGSSSTASSAPRPCASPATTRCAAASSISTRRAWPSRCGSISSATRWRSIRSFDPETQRTTDQLRALDLVPVAEFQLTTETIRRFRARLCRGLRRAVARRPALRRGERGPAPSRHGALAAAVPRAARHAVRLSAGLAGRARAAGGGCRA